MLDLLFEKEDPSCRSLSDGFKNTLFSSSEGLHDDDDVDIKEEVLDSGTIDWKMPSEWDADELLRSVLDGNDMSSPSLGTHGLTPLGSLGSSSHHTLDPSSLSTPTLEAPDDMDSLENLVGLPFHAVLDSAASDSGMSSDSSLDQQMSPLSGYSSPGSLTDMGMAGGLGMASPDPAVDATSDVSSTSDLGSLGSLGSTSPTGNSSVVASPHSPDNILSLEDFIHPDSGFSSPVPHDVGGNTISSAKTVTTPIFTTARPTFITKTAAPVTTTIVNRSAAPSIITKPSASTTTGPVLKTVTVAAPANSVGSVGGQTIVVTQANRGGGNAHVVRGGTLLKSNPTSRSILLPVTVKDLNQVRTIKIISTGGNGGVGGRGVRTVVSTVRTPSTTSSTPSPTTSLNSQSIRTSLLSTVRGQESKSILKGGATTVLTTSARPAAPTTTSFIHSSPTRIKVESRDDIEDDDDDDDDDEPHTSFQQLTLSDEEKRLLKKEGIMLPSHYPLTKQEERELKRIRRKIRNKISAQDSRKRKKEYIDGLEDRVKACTEENQQLQKRIRSLEAQNESLLVQMRRFQNAVTGGSSGRLQTHASTALMMLILSAALFIVPSMRQDGGSSADSELSMPSSKMPSAGHSRSLLEVGNMGTLEVLEGVEDEVTLELETPLTQALSDHDYTPVAKKQRTATPRGTAYFVPPLDDYPPPHDKTDSGGGFPPDDSGSGTKLSARIMDSLADHMSNNYSDPGGKSGGNSKAVVVNLSKGKKRLRDDLELE